MKVKQEIFAVSNLCNFILQAAWYSTYGVVKNEILLFKEKFIQKPPNSRVDYLNY